MRPVRQNLTHVEPFSGRQLQDFLARLDATGFRFIALRLDPDLSEPVLEADLLAPLFGTSLRRSLRKVAVTSPYRYAVLKSSSLSSKVVVGCESSSALSIVLLDVRGPILKDGARYSLSFRAVVHAGVTRASGFLQPNDEVESVLLQERNRLDNRLPSAKHRRILGKATGRYTSAPIWSARQIPGIRLLSRISAIQKRTYTIFGGRRVANIALHGPDGSGKSTAAHAVTQALQGVGLPAITWHYLKPTSRDRLTSPRRPETFLRGQTRRRLGWPGVVLKAIYRTRVTNAVLVHDRYILDVLEKNVRKGVHHSPMVERIVAWLSGNFSTPFLLHGPMSRLVARGEQSPSEIQATIARAQLIPRCIEIDSGYPPAVLAAAIIQEWLLVNSLGRRADAD